jgi:hypothetical protein
VLRDPLRGSARLPYGRRRAIVFAFLLAVVVIAGYAGYRALASGGDGGSDRFVTTVRDAQQVGRDAITLGTNFHDLAEQYAVHDQFTMMSVSLSSRRSVLDRIATSSTGVRHNAAAEASLLVGELQNAINDYRDAIFDLRLGDVADAESAITRAVDRLGQQIDAWNQVSS